MFSFIFFALVASAAALAVDQRCPEVQPAANFQYDEFRHGKWYEYSRYVTNMREMGECGYSEYKPENDVFHITNCNVLKGKQRCISGTGRMAPDADNHGKLICSYPYGPNGSMIDSDLNVLATDNKNYAILYFCKYVEQKNMLIELSWVFTRSKDISDESLASVNKFLDESTVLDKSKFKRSVFSEEACKVE